MADDIEALVNSAVERALGGDAKPAASAASTRPAPQQPAPDRIDKLIDLMTVQATAAMASSPTFRAGAPSGAPDPGPGYDPAKPGTLKHATREQVAQLRSEGKLKAAAEAFRGSMGGGGRLFPARNPGGSK